MVPRFGFQTFELKRSLPFAFAEPWSLAFALVGSHLARLGAAGGRALATRES